MGFQDASSANENDHKSAASVNNGNHPGETEAEEPKKKNICLDFFDPTLALACIQVVRKKRENLKHFIIWFLIVSYIIIAGTAQGKVTICSIHWIYFATLFGFFFSLIAGEAEYLYQFTRLQLNWNGVDLSYYITYTTVISLIGKRRYLFLYESFIVLFCLFQALYWWFPFSVNSSKFLTQWLDSLHPFFPSSPSQF